MKFKFKILTALLLLATAPSVFSQTFAQFPVGGTNFVAATATNAYTHYTAVVRSRIVTVQPSFKMLSSSTATITFGIDLSTDAATWVTNASSMTITANGTTPVSALAAVDTGGAAYIRIGYVQNTSAVIATNITANFAFKPGL